MSWKMQYVSCPRGHSQSIRVPTRLEVITGAEARAAFLEGRFGQVTCPACDRPFRVEQQLTWCDFARRHFLLVLPPSTLRTWSDAEPHVSTLLDGVLAGHGSSSRAERFLVRLAFGYEQLREKLLLWDAGLDDRLIEVLKLEAFARPELGLGASGRFVLMLERIDLDARRLWFTARRLEAPHQPERIFVGLEQYHTAQQQLEAHHSSYPELFETSFVNALRYLMPGQSEGTEIELRPS